MKLIYAPKALTSGLSKFGLNKYGQPNFRCIWGPSRTSIVGGFWADTGKHEYRLSLKYGKQPRWVVERWRPSTIYGTPEQWDNDYITPDGFYAIGPYPTHGEYESVEMFQAKDDSGRPIKGWAGFIPLEPGLVELVARAVVMGKINTYSDIRNALRDQAVAKERDSDRRFDEMWREKQATRDGLTFGYGSGYVNKAEEINEYARRIEKAKAFVRRDAFTPGFAQDK